MKKFMMLATILVAGLFIMPNVYATSLPELVNGNVSEITATNDGNGHYTLTLNDNAEADIYVGTENGKPDGTPQSVTLKLNGHTLTNCTLGYAAINIDAAGAKVVIEDTTGGKITGKDNSTEGVSLIRNMGTLEINGGTIISNIKKSQGIENRGTLVIDGGNVTSASQGSTLAEGGSWGITNFGNATIKNGTFTQEKEFSLIQNSGTMTINGGEFKAGEGSHSSFITNSKNEGNNADLTISGGNFTVTTVLNNSSDGNVLVTGGKFTNATTIKNYLAEGLIISADGSVVKESPQIAEEQKEKANPNTSDINLYLLLSLIAVSGCGIAYTVKRRFN